MICSDKRERKRVSRKKNPSADSGDTSPSAVQIMKADPSTIVTRSPGPPSETLACEVHGSAIDAAG